MRLADLRDLSLTYAEVGATAGDLHHAARRDERPEPTQHVAADLGHLGGGGDP